MKKLFLILTFLCIALTFAGAGYVLVNQGTVNAGFAVIPMLFTLLCAQGFRAVKDQ